MRSTNWLEKSRIYWSEDCIKMSPSEEGSAATSDLAKTRLCLYSMLFDYKDRGNPSTEVEAAIVREFCMHSLICSG